MTGQKGKIVTLGTKGNRKQKKDISRKPEMIEQEALPQIKAALGDCD